jgi:hypothetical protein
MQHDPPILVVPRGTGWTPSPVNLIDAFMPAFAVMLAFVLTGHMGQTVHRDRPGASRSRRRARWSVS